MASHIILQSPTSVHGVGIFHTSAMFSKACRVEAHKNQSGRYLSTGASIINQELLLLITIDVDKLCSSIKAVMKKITYMKETVQPLSETLTELKNTVN